MKRLSVVLITLALFVLPSFATAGTWNIDPDHSQIGFKVRHMMVTNVHGVFQKYNGSVNIDDSDITKSKIEVGIETASIDTRVAKRDTHLKSADFFDVAKYPTMTFVSKKVEKAGENGLKVTGDLTLHGVTREVVLDVEGPSPTYKDPWGNFKRGASASTTISRQDFGLTWNAALETGGVVVGDEVTITLEIELLKI